MADNKENNSQNMTDSVDTALRKVDLNAKDAAAVAAAAAASETTKVCIYIINSKIIGKNHIIMYKL